MSRKSRAFVTFLMLNDSFLPGALMVAFSLRHRAAVGSDADIVCLVTPEITSEAREALSLLFDHVLEVPRIFLPHRRAQRRQHTSSVFTRLQALRLGEDGDLGQRVGGGYRTIAILDADLLPLRDYQELFALTPPAGIINERKEHFVELDGSGGQIVPPHVRETGRWVWHRIYNPVCPHGAPIPRSLTDRVASDPTNLGINGSLFVLEPSAAELHSITEELEKPEIRRRVTDLYEWPDMQYLSLRWSGRWTSIDVKFAGFNGYPDLSVLNGTHFAGVKPWYFKREKTIQRYRRYPDFQLWYRLFHEMVTGPYAALARFRRIRTLREQVKGVLT